MNDFVTLASLGTTVGAAGLTLLIVQYIKPLFPQSFNTRLLALIVAFIIMSVVTIATGGGFIEYALAVLNSFVVAGSAMGAYTVTFAKTDKDKKQE